VPSHVVALCASSLTETADFATMSSLVDVTHGMNWHGAAPEMKSDSGTELLPLFSFGARLRSTGGGASAGFGSSLAKLRVPPLGDTDQRANAIP